MKIITKGVFYCAFIFFLMNGVNGYGQSFNGYRWETLSCKGEPSQRHEAAFKKFISLPVMPPRVEETN